MLWTSLALMLVVASSGGQRTGRCDLVEVNHFCQPDGSDHFTQIIAWEWMPDSVEYHVQDWRLIDRW